MGKSVWDTVVDASNLQGAVDHYEGALKDEIWAKAGLLADGVGFGQALGVAHLEKAAGLCAAEIEFARAWATPIIASALACLVGYTIALGSSVHPDKGEPFDAGGAQFGRIGDELAAARPSGAWAGDGSDRYRERCDDQLRRAQRMKSVDERLRDVLKEEAEQVQQTRDIVDHCATTLGLAIPLALYLLAIEPEGIIASATFQTAAANAALAVASPAFLAMGLRSSANAGKIQQLADEYAEIAASATLSGPAREFVTNAAPASTGETTKGTQPAGPSTTSGASAGSESGSGGTASGGVSGPAPGTAPAATWPASTPPSAGTRTAGGGAAGHAGAGNPATTPGGAGPGLLGTSVGGPLSTMPGQHGQSGTPAAAGPSGSAAGVAGGLPGQAGSSAGNAVAPVAHRQPAARQSATAQETPAAATSEGAAGVAGPRAPIPADVEPPVVIESGPDQSARPSARRGEA